MTTGTNAAATAAPGDRAILRQVVIGAPDLAATTALLRERLGLPVGFGDPLLEEIGMADETIRVGDEAHLEVVAPLHGDVSLAHWIAKGGGGGGYALSVQVPDLAPHLAAVAADGVRVVADLDAYGHRIVQLHPGDMGLLVELDEIADPTEWFWDDVESEVATAPAADDVLAVEVRSPDPAGQARRWSSVLLAPLEPQRDALWLGRRQVRFVPGDRRMLGAVDLAATEHGEVGSTFTVDGLELRLLVPTVSGRGRTPPATAS